MDTTETTHISLCSGYGGIDLGLRRVIPDLRTVAYAEIEAFACENLLARMEGGQIDAAPIWSDLKSFPWEQFSGLVDILSGGYPCQPFSAAGKRAGADDPRHLWPFISSGIQVLRPRLCFFENVEGHISLGLREVIADLENLGYQTAWGIFSAAEVGAPHQRKRVFILAYRSGEGLQGDIARLLVQSGRQISSGSSRSGELADSDSAGSRQNWEPSQPWATGIEQPSCFERRGDAGEVRERQAWPSRPGQPQHAWEPPRVVEHTNGNRRECNVAGHAAQPDSDRQDNGVFSETDTVGNASLLDGSGQGGGQREAQAGRTDTARDNGQTQPALGGDTDGAADWLDHAELCVTCDNRTDELRLLGNGVVPATAALAFRTLLKELAQ